MMNKLEVCVFGFKVKLLLSLELPAVAESCLRFADSIDSDAALNRLHMVVFSNKNFLSDNDNVIFCSFFIHGQQLCFDKGSL